MGRCTSTTQIPNVRGKRDAKGELIMVEIRCQDGTEGHAGPHFNGHHGDAGEHTQEW